jgi:chromosome segregation ATPase
VADAAKKSPKDKPKPKKVYTEDDLSGMRKGAVSVVGNENKKSPRRARTTEPEGDYDPNSEEYWRGRAQPLLDDIAATDAQIEQLKEDIKKYGASGIDVTTGMKDNVAYIHDRNGQIQDLQKKKADLQKQLDDLAEEGRKAGAQPAWFR